MCAVQHFQRSCRRCNATAIASDDINANEEILTADGENFDDVLAVDENDADKTIAKNDADDKSVLSVQNDDGDVLSAGDKTVNVNIYKQTGTYCTDKKIYQISERILRPLLGRR